jgi:Carboxypeptidase regulatory-like domain/TonB dependent receptor
MKAASQLNKLVYFVGLWTLTVALFMSAAFAQNSGAGTITGTLTDPAGSVVPGAAVAVRNTNTGATLSLTTNGAGIYVAPFLPPGMYEITASKTGFGKIARKDLTLQVGQTLTIDLALPLQTTTETVTVSGQPSVVDTQKTDMSQVVSAAQQENLPLAGRRWESFALMTPNVTTDGGSGLIAYRGISGLYNSSAVDGTNNSQAFFSETKGRTTIPYIYSMDSIQEFQVASSNYSAELGQAAGGVVNAVTKSGTNALHGDLFYYLRYPTLNALDSLQKSKGIYTQPIHQQQQFGGSVGGPIIRDKLFYFLTYDGSRKINPISYTSSAAFPIACTYSQITPAQCAAANKYLSGLLGAYPRFQNQDVGFGKLDYLFTPANRVSASFNLDNFKSPNSYNTATTANANSNSANGTAVTRERIFVANWDSTINPTTINDFRFQWSQDLEIISANGTAPSVTIDSGVVMAYGMPNALPRPAFPNEHRLQFNDVLSKTVGRHTFKAGVDFNAIHEVLINLFSGGGVYGYTGSITGSFSNWAADVMGINVGDGNTGRHYSSFLQVTDPVTGVGKDDFYDNDWAGFAEDSWKVRSNLTLNLGIRYDLFLIPQPPKPNTSTPLTTLYTSTINIPKNQFAPRLGAAWEVRKGTVVRLGYGIFYGKTSNSTYYATRVENGEFQQTYNCTSPLACPGLSFPNVIFTAPGGPPVAPFPGALTPTVTLIKLSANTATTRGQDPGWVNPMVHEGEVTVDQQLPGNIGVSASYVFSRALHLPVFTDANLSPTTATKTYTYPDGGTFTVPFYTSANRVNNTGSILVGRSVVNSLYNSFVLTVRKRMQHGVEFVANYTLSKAEDDGQVGGQFGTFNGTDYTVDPYNQKGMWSLSDLDQRQRLVTDLIWKPEFAANWSNKAAKMIVNGYTLSSIFTIASGQPVTGLISGSTSGLGAIDGGLTGGMVNNSGSAPSPYEDPRVARNFYAGPGFWDVDARVSREFRIKERYRLSFLAEAFNIFNHTNIFAVNTTQYSLSGTTLSRSATFLIPTATNNGLYGARQLQISGRFTF